jgi:dihydrofolate synthase/folylpolyglutamate synthase
LAEQLEETGYRIGEEAVRQGLAAARWPGRLEVVSRAPLTILDGAHNPDGARALRLALEELLPGGKVALVTAVMADKDAGEILVELAPAVARVYPVKADNPRSMAPEDLSAVARRLDLSARVLDGGLPAALVAAREAVLSGEAAAVLVAGSLYLVGEARGLLL